MAERKPQTNLELIIKSWNSWLLRTMDDTPLERALRKSIVQFWSTLVAMDQNLISPLYWYAKLIPRKHGFEKTLRKCRTQSLEHFSKSSSCINAR